MLSHAAQGRPVAEEDTSTDEEEMAALFQQERDKLQAAAKRQKRGVRQPVAGKDRGEPPSGGGSAASAVHRVSVNPRQAPVPVPVPPLPQSVRRPTPPPETAAAAANTASNSGVSDYVVVLMLDEQPALQAALEYCATTCQAAIHADCFQRPGSRHFTFLRLGQLTAEQAARVQFVGPARTLPLVRRPSCDNGCWSTDDCVS